MCKSRFNSQGVMLDAFFPLNTLKAGETPPPFMAIAILNFHF